MASLGDLVANVKMDSRQFISGADKARRSLGSFVKSTTSGLAQIGLAAQGLRTVFGSLQAPLDEFREGVLAQKKLVQVFKTTGHVAGLAAKDIEEYAAQREALTNFQGDQTINAAAILGSFTGIRGGIFTEALTSAQDLSAFMGQDLQSSILMVGKALNDPAKGITALTRAGVGFTAQQKEQIKALQEAGKLADAQRIILGEMQTQFGGQAQALADPITQAANAWDNFLETVGKGISEGILPLMPKLIEGFTQLSSAVEASGKHVKNVMDDFEGFALVAAAIATNDPEGVAQSYKEMLAAQVRAKAKQDAVISPERMAPLQAHRDAIAGIRAETDKLMSLKPDTVEIEEPQIDLSGVTSYKGDKTMNDVRKMTSALRPGKHEAGQMLARFVSDGIEAMQRGVLSLGPAGKDGNVGNIVGSLERGSNEAFETLRANMGQGAKDLQKDQLKELEKVNKNLEKLAKSKAKEGETFVVKDVD